MTNVNRSGKKGKNHAKRQYLTLELKRLIHRQSQCESAHA